MEFGNDDLDELFPDEAIDNFVNGINLDFGESDTNFLNKLTKSCNS